MKVTGGLCGVLTIYEDIYLQWLFGCFARAGDGKGVGEETPLGELHEIEFAREIRENWPANQILGSRYSNQN